MLAAEKFSIGSQYPNRDHFSVIVQRPTEASSNIFILYIYGGGCTFEANESYLELEHLTGLFLEKGFSLAIPHYRENLEFDAINMGNAKTQQQVCIDSTKVYLDDLKRSVQEIQKRYQPSQIFVWGHSFGAFLANVWAADPIKDSSIGGFISSNGWWDPTKEYVLDFLSPKSLSPLNSAPQTLSKLLVIHTQDDRRVPVSQVEKFRNWADPGTNFRILIFPKGGHSPLDENYPTTEFIEEISKFIGSSTEPL